MAIIVLYICWFALLCVDILIIFVKYLFVDMKAFVKKILLFVTVCYVLLLVLDILVSNELKTDMPIKNPDLVLLGSSRCQAHFDSRIIEDSLGIKTVNIGLYSSKIDIHYMILKEYLDYTTCKPKYLTYVFDIHDNTFVDNKVTRHYQFFPSLLYNLNYYSILRKYSGFNSSMFFCPMIRYSGYLKQYINGCTTFLYKDYSPIDKTMEINDVDPFYRNPINYEYKYDSAVIVFYMQKIINLCKVNNVKLNLVYAPEYFLCRFALNREASFSIFLKIADDNDIPVKDFSSDSVLNSNSAYFSDILHLNRKGAEVFTSSYYVPYMKQLIECDSLIK